jgi:hypothetical protein
MKLSEMHNKPTTTGRRKMKLAKELRPPRKQPTYGPRRWRNYQADGWRYKGVRIVADMSEAEAKDELCDAMDLIAELKSNALKSMLACEEQKY